MNKIHLFKWVDVLRVIKGTDVNLSCNKNEYEAMVECVDELAEKIRLQNIVCGKIELPEEVEEEIEEKAEEVLEDLLEAILEALGEDLLIAILVGFGIFALSKAEKKKMIEDIKKLQQDLTFVRMKVNNISDRQVVISKNQKTILDQVMGEIVPDPFYKRKVEILQPGVK